jgi:hypothetical protein
MLVSSSDQRCRGSACRVAVALVSKSNFGSENANKCPDVSPAQLSGVSSIGREPVKAIGLSPYTPTLQRRNPTWARSHIRKSYHQHTATGAIHTSFPRYTSTLQNQGFRVLGSHLRILGLLSCICHRVEAHVCEEHERRRADDGAPAGGSERYPVGGVHFGGTHRDHEQDDGHLGARHHGVDRGRLLDAL